MSMPASTDDSDYNTTAAKIKNKLEKALAVQNKDGAIYNDNAYCDLMIEMRHSAKYATIKRVTARGSYKLCKNSKRWLKTGKKFHYETPEKFIRLQIVASDIQ
ncbi:hypothetical protein RCJ22_24165 [Vibrio sp. FNV 38]|nr:hypothetical protein [Vibrio sp. FNV 38]